MLKKLIIVSSIAIASIANADITVGQSVPTTGLSADTGKALALGASIYFGRLNARGGINGENINLVVKDDAYDPNRTVQNAKDLIEKDNALALISFYGTGSVGELIKSKVLENSRTALVGVHSGAESLRNPVNPYVFHTRASYAQETEKIIKLLTGNLGVTKVAVLAQKDAYGEAGMAGVKAALDKRQLKVLQEVWYDKNKPDTAQAAAELAKLNPEAIILVAVSKPAASFIKQFKEKGGTSQIYGLSPIQFEEVGRAIGNKTAHGLGISQTFPYPYNTQVRFIREFQTDAEMVLRNNPAAEYKSSDYPSYALLEGYLAARVVAEAIKRAGKAPTREGVLNALNNMGRLDLGGFAIDFSDKKHVGSSFVELTMMSPTGALTR
ncbi:ABC transporter substrate-binding protein [Chitinibacter bivalviorum]|uniref:ABC transporter substrate-binding protein n=1 Tax=Chitinibacter bivalviorum TaxID=2739434 RepID=A0A7H9BEG6_9NEIS|nr:ABC transporter substrate-binding protein [Chitinibacter bivalviorum]QLG86927.1 ABC transporter substrate-binding protein [Chitinibacter bivalviorum]